MIHSTDPNEITQIWTAVKSIIQEKKNLPDTVMKLWFADARLTILTEDTAVVVIASNFKRHILYTRYRDDIAEALSQILGFPVAVSIKSSEQEDALAARMTEAADAVPASDDPSAGPSDAAEPAKGGQARDLYSTVGDVKVLNRAAVPSAFTEYTFENFIVGKSNEFAHAAALSVADHPAGQANPLFLHGPSGLGKTHLLYAITNRINQNFPQARVVYVKGEDFTNQLIDAISRNLTAEFRDKYRSTDVLLIDDIQFIAGKESTQEEFFHTFDHLHENGKQIILASDLPPRDIQRLSERLRGRFESGVMADITPPDLELRTAIVKKKVEALNTAFPPEVMNYIAENLTKNVRQLEGAVKRISAQHKLTGMPITVDMAIRCLSDQVVGSEPASVTVDKILSEVGAHFRLPVSDLKSRKQTSSVATARHVAIYLIRELTDLSLPAIGRLFNRDHTTIMNSYDTVKKRFEQNPAFEKEVKALETRLRGT